MAVKRKKRSDADIILGRGSAAIASYKIQHLKWEKEWYAAEKEQRDKEYDLKHKLLMLDVQRKLDEQDYDWEKKR